LIEYPQNMHLPDEYILEKLSEFWEEDMPNGDITTLSTISKKTLVKAEIQAVEKFVFVGETIIPLCFGKDCHIQNLPQDGETIGKGDLIGNITGPAQLILSRERVMLNLIQRLCGIATTAQQYAEIAKPHNIKILDTRKTTPGLRLFEKYAIAIGGAYNHRLNLSDGVLIKDNHIVAAGSITKAIECARNANISLPIELEVDSLGQIQEALLIGVDGFLLDNMYVDTIRSAVLIIRNSKNGQNIFIEISGGITIDNIHQYLDTGINAISVGALTHQIISKDIRLEFNS